MHYSTRFIMLLLIVCCIIVLRFMGVFDWINIATIQSYAHDMEQWVEHHYFNAVMSYIMIITLASILTIPITALMTVASGFLFGVLLGTMYSALGATLGGLIVFLMVRYGIGDWMQKKYGHKLHHINKEIEQYGHWYIMMLHVSPMTPTPLLTIGAGLTNIAWWRFVVAMFIGVLPGSLIYAWAGYQLHTLETIQDIMSVPLIVLLLLITLICMIPVIWRMRL